ncbi:NAD(P)/FAD-dependent oxidoreductase [Thiocystis violascens]|uniref:NADH dehydrogenase, FAD-containing subunit n=1 Tax=Thiocystis violascens (strain ATCC 17096 / DSM 198 / 6111) TaxID=765911 RepID=I3Y9N1_THIV6|nr:NAD(P)/FAD-dependent oxidoreductase [Thiocystis violascens]AFL73699.1 NADH dehydrogenase, FAD-containing subunit [Thiocystis violascens DSM 198]
MTDLQRRAFLKSSALAMTAALLGASSRLSATTPKARILVVGGGFGGAIAAKYLGMADPDLRVTLVEKEPVFISCPMSNEVLSGERDLKDLTFGYRGLTRQGIAVVQDEIVEIDPVQHFARGASGNRYNYDKLILSPGVGYRWDAIEGLSEAVSERYPHAWKAGPQTLTLRRQLEAMEDGGVFAIVAPPNPFRCPPGPYERAAQVAQYFKRHKPNSKILILDAKDAFSKQGLFQAGWKQHYGEMIEWVPAAGGGTVEAIHPDSGTLVGEVEEYRGDVISLIPHQKAGAIAERAGLTDATGWCPVDQQTFASSLHPDIHVIGDACIAGAMPKSGYSANSQGKVCAAAIVAAIHGNAPPEPSYVNTCYSLIAPDHGISVAGVYALDNGRIQEIAGAGGVSPMDADARYRAVEARFAHDWFRNITADMFT